MIDVILVDDHELFRMGVQKALDKEDANIRLIGEAETGEELFCLLENLSPHIILLDIILPDMSGVEIATRLKKERPEIKILALSAENTKETINNLLDIGIDGFISKRMSNTGILSNAIHNIAGGEKFFGKDIAEIIYRIYIAKTTTVSADFTEQEKKIIEFSRQGMNSKLIAKELCISSRTVNNHKNNIFRKLGINNTMEMVQYAIKKRIIGEN